MTNFSVLRNQMVNHQIAVRGIRSGLVLDALRSVPREEFIPKNLREFAYEDTPLPIGEGQTISQPYIVALMIDALGLKGGESVLEIGAGSGYAAAVLAQIAGEVYTVERLGQIASKASATVKSLGYNNIHILHGDGTLGWAEHAPYDAIVVAAGGPSIPNSLKSQLKIGGRLVIPIGSEKRLQELVCVTRTSELEYRIEDIADVGFVPLIGEEGWEPENVSIKLEHKRKKDLVSDDKKLLQQIAGVIEPFENVESVNLDSLLERVGEARIVLLGEATHGTKEFYEMRSQITRQLIEKKGFNFIAIEGDWPDAAQIDNYIRHVDCPITEWTAFARFPIWMWRNNSVKNFIDWLHSYNAEITSKKKISFYGLDLYSLYNSIDSILKYLDDIDPDAASIARERYGCLSPWQKDPATYGRLAISGAYQSCEKEVLAMLTDILQKKQDYTEYDGERFLDTVQNARLVANAERYYRVMYYGSRESWNLRDMHMFETLKLLLNFHGAESKVIIWAHNSHVGDASATEMFRRGEYNLGYLCRQELNAKSYSIGFGTNDGTVAAASNWDQDMEIKRIRPAISKSYEYLFHQLEDHNFLLGLNGMKSNHGLDALSIPRLERAIGVIYRPETELASHYFQANLPKQFDEYIWIDRTQAVTPIEAEALKGLPDTYPFGL
jgi:protein-L-isoaspartate(D-aspartate) O-methyltransferase